MTVAARRSSIVARSSAARRFAAVERLRRALFSPSKLLTVGALALALSAGSAFAQENVMPNASILVVTENSGYVDITGYSYSDPNQSYDQTIALEGGGLALSGDVLTPVYDKTTKTLYLRGFDKPYKVELSDEVRDMYLNSLKVNDIDLTKIYGDIDKIVEQNAHYLDLSEGGVLDVSSSQNSNADLRKYIDSQGVSVSSQEIKDMLTKIGNGSLTFTGDDGATTKFSGGLSVGGGTVNVATNAVYDESFLLAWGSGFTALEGTQTFNTTVNIYQSQMDITSTTESKKTFMEDVFVSDGSSLYSWGNVAYNGTVGIDKSQAVFSGVVPGLSAGNTTWGTNSKLNIYGGGKVYANANCVDVDLTLSNGGVLTYINVDNDNMDEAILDKFYVTLDEKQTPTVLEWTAGSANIAKALENNNLITHDVISADASTILYFHTMGTQTANSLGEANGYTVVFNNAEGKKFDYAGMTIVDNAFMVVQGDTNFGAKNATGTGGSNFAVYGEAYLNLGEGTWKVQGSGMLGFDRDDASATSAPSITANLVHFDSGVATVSLEDFTSVCTRHLQDIITNTDPANLDVMAAIAESQDRAYAEYKSNSHIGGSRIWLDTTFNGQYASENDKTFKLGAINADKIIFASDTQIWYDGISTKPTDVKMTFDLNAPTIEYAVVSDELTMEPSKGDSDLYEITRKTIKREDAEGNDVPTTVGEIEDLFGQAVLVDAKYELAAAPANDVATALTEEGRRAQTATAGTVTVTAKSVGQYAEGQNMSAKERELAGKLDGARVQGGKSTSFYDALYNETDGEKVKQTIHNLSLLGYTMLNSQGHFGNPTSSFFGGANISGEAKRGQERQEDWAAEANQPEQKSEIAKEKNDYNPTRGLWAAYTHTSVDGEDYKFGGVTTHGYKLRRDGIIGGIRRQIDATTSAGLFFGLSMPEVASSARLNAGGQITGNGYGVVSSSMEMTDFQYAVHFERVFADAWELAAYVGGGTQAMEWERRADLSDSGSGMYKYKADGSGSTFTGTLYLSYRADVNDALTLRPTIGVDTEHSWLYGFEEKGGLEGQDSGNVALNPYTDMFAQAYRYKKTYYARNTARVGLSLAYSNPRNDMLGANARVFYGVKLGGEDAPELTYYNENYRWENMSSHEMGDSSLNVGGGGFMHLNPIKTLTATGDVNAIWYKNAQTFNVTGGVSYRF